MFRIQHVLRTHCETSKIPPLEKTRLHQVCSTDVSMLIVKLLVTNGPHSEQMIKRFKYVLQVKCHSRFNINVNENVSVINSDRTVSTGFHHCLFNSTNLYLCRFDFPDSNQTRVKVKRPQIQGQTISIFLSYVLRTICCHLVVPLTTNHSSTIKSGAYLTFGVKSLRF